MRKYVLCMLFLLLLTSCQSASRQAESPTPAPTPTPAAVTPTPTETVTSAGFHAPEGLELDVGDGEHKFWIEITEREEEVGGVWVNIYRDKEDAEPYQRFEDRAFSFHRAGPHSVDADFDGNMDFYFECDWGSLPVFWFNHYIWDATEERFVQDPYGLNDIPNVQFDSEREVVTSWENRATVCYQYEDGQLVKVGESFDPEEENEAKAYSGHRVKVDEDHVFWVEITQREEWEWGEGKGIPILVSVYEESSGELKQSFEDEVWLYNLGAATPREVDVNFDGCMDFEYGSWIAASSGGSVYYVWDKEAEQFVRDPYGLEDLAMPSFDQERQVIETWNHSGASYTIEFYRYLDGKLTCVRRLRNQDNYSDDFTATLTVEDYDEKTGTLKEVYREENAKIGGVTYASTEEFQRWENPDYPGE